MPLPTLVQIEDDRRRHPRRPSNHPLVIEMMLDGELIPCDSIDVSVGGMRVRAMEPIPLGPCDIVVFADTEHPLILMGEVLEVLESSPDQSIARIVFLPVLSDSADAGRGSEAVERALPIVAGGPVRRRGTILLAASIVAGLVSLGGVHFATGPGELPLEIPAAAAVGVRPAAPVATPPVVTSTPASVPTTAVSPPTTVAPVARPVTAEPAALPVKAEPAAAPVAAPAAATYTEQADNLVHVTLGTTAEDTAVSSFVGPSEGVDRLRVHLNVTPEPEGTSLPLEVTFENRGDHTVTFPDGFRVTITSTRDGVVLATPTFAADITEVAPGQVVLVGGLFDFGSTGEHDLTVDIDVTE